MFLKITPEELLLVQKEMDTILNPVRVKVKPENGNLPDYCFENVLGKIRKKGGKMILGRKLFKSPFLIEAEYHAIYQSATGELVDLTPQHTDAIQFIPIPNTEYNGQTLDTILINYTKNPVIDDYIKLEKTYMAFRNMGSLAGKSGAIALTQEEGIRYTLLTQTKTGIIDFIGRNGNMQSPCFCKKNDTYENCHHKNIDLLISEILTPLF